MSGQEPEPWDGNLQGCTREGCGCIIGFLFVLPAIALIAALWEVLS